MIGVTVMLYTQEVENNAITSLMATLGIVLLAGFFLVSSNSELEIRDGALRYKVWPFVPKWRSILPTDIVSWEIKKINPLTYAGGWGYRKRFWKNKTAIVMRGNTGLEMKLSNGKTMFFSTEEPDSLEREMKKLMEKEEEVF